MKTCFVVFFCVFFPPLLNVLLLLGPYCFCPLLWPSLHEIFPWYLQISWWDLQSFPFYCLPLFLFIVHLVRLSYLELCIQLSLSFPFSFAFCFSSFLSYFNGSSDNHFAFLHLFFLGMFWVTISCTMLWTTIQNSSGILSIKSSPWIYLATPLYNHKEFDLNHTWIT